MGVYMSGQQRFVVERQDRTQVPLRSSKAHYSTLFKLNLIYLICSLWHFVRAKPSSFCTETALQTTVCTKKQANYAKGNYKKDPGWECAALCMHCSEADHGGP